MNMNKTVAVVINTSWNIFNFRLGLLKALQKEGYKIVAIAPKDEYAEELEALGFEYHNIDINNKGTSPYEDAKLVFAFYKLYKDIAPDVLLQYTIKPNIYGSMAAGMLGIPVISNISGLGTVFLNDSFSSKIARFLYKIALKVPKKVFYQNAHDRELFVNSNLVKEEKTDILPGSGIDTEKFKPLDIKEPKNDTVRFLFIARLVRDKGIEEYVHAARRLKSQWIPSARIGNALGVQAEDDVEVEFCILGAFYPGNPTAISEAEVKLWETDKIVKYIGTSDDVRTVISEYDCIVLPSYREGLSRVLLEAACMAKPIIATDVPGCKEVVDDGVNGYLCNVRDADSLANQMQNMINLSDEERREMGQRGREKVIREFDEGIVINRYREAISSILHPKGIS